MKAPSVEISSATARVVARRLRKAGFPLFKDHSKRTGDPSVDGFWVHKMGDRVEVNYLGYNAHLRHHAISEKELSAYKFLRAEGYAIDDKGFIQCTYNI
jgi:metal-dependent HD superfamily phosphatase/phosphodiesterase